MDQILLPVAAIGGMGLIFGALLAVAAKIFAVDKDERIPLITEALPGANCGGCGFAGCSAYASAVAEGKAAVNCCPVGGSAAAEKIAAIMGVDAGESVRTTAFVMCSGSKDVAQDKYITTDKIDCHVANRLGGGMKNCAFGCLGFGSCVSKCKYDAIHVVNGAAVVDSEKCTSCGACIKECPRGIIKRIPYGTQAAVACASRANGKVVRAVCGVGCIGCGICAKNCESGAITLDGSLAAVDPAKCTACGVCIEKCPRKIIKLTEASAQMEEKPDICVVRRAKRG